ncbi:cobalamin B12-binding domain-containing protein [Paenibacillus hexagrammi]|uniref:Cobalamin B12-binding domain-containing protein n=1 Tax=Paenibacillus hexagrammi TaxID=2908839 RepID=A0ABY3SK77_9BACL|nr:cobalamin B12-binding domain-containing protein [Paenibacillus sp. YPD9-1]UJF34114.1 cobalamin B12-binding domain-containing protein [Paenibacillus sp. YPD9-1]
MFYSASEQLSELLLTGNHQEMWRLLRQHVDAGKNSLYIYDSLLTSSMRHVGYLWEQNLISVADEHLASILCNLAIANYKVLIGGTSKIRQKRAMFLCVEGEQHELGVKMISSYFEEFDWDARCFGPNLPLEYAMSAAMNWKPQVIGISVALAYHVPQLREYIHALENLSHKPMIMVGGRAASVLDLKPYVSEKTVIFKDLYELHSWLEANSTQQLRQTWG